MSPPVTTSPKLQLGSRLVNPPSRRRLVRFRLLCNHSDMVTLLAETVTLGDAIRRFRIRAGLSQRSLSEVSGVERSYISVLENSRRSSAPRSRGDGRNARNRPRLG